MQAFILEGEKALQEKFLTRFYQENNIKKVNQYHFFNFKIFDARLVRKLISQKLHTFEKRAITISNPTVEAQHALLKTLEELPASSFIFFLGRGKHEFLPTILSRCLVVSSGVSTSANKDIKKELADIFNDDDLMNKKNAFLFCENHAIDKDLIDQTIIASRELLLQNLEHKKKCEALYHFIKSLISINPYITENNVQPRFFLETAFHKKITT